MYEIFKNKITIIAFSRVLSLDKRAFANEL